MFRVRVSALDRGLSKKLRTLSKFVWNQFVLAGKVSIIDVQNGTIMSGKAVDSALTCPNLISSRALHRPLYIACRDCGLQNVISDDSNTKTHLATIPHVK